MASSGQWETLPLSGQWTRASGALEERQDADGLLRAVDDLVSARGSLGGKTVDLAGRELALAVWLAEPGTARHDDSPLLAADLVVVRPGLLARGQLVEAAAEQGPAQALADGRHPVAVARAVVFWLFGHSGG
jgi:hypothetical protein